MFNNSRNNLSGLSDITTHKQNEICNSVGLISVFS